MIMKMADGRLFDTVTKKFIEQDVQAPAENISLSEVTFLPAPKTTVRVEELPSNAREMTVISAIIGFKFLGLPDTEICYALKCDLEQLQSIMATEAYEWAQRTMIEAFVAGQTKAAQDIIVRQAASAANVLVGIMNTSKNEKNKLQAAIATLDRAGITDQSKNGSMSQGLVIKVVRDADASNIEVKIGV